MFPSLSNIIKLQDSQWSVSSIHLSVLKWLLIRWSYEHIHGPIKTGLDNNFHFGLLFPIRVIYQNCPFFWFRSNFPKSMFAICSKWYCNALLYVSRNRIQMYYTYNITFPNFYKLHMKYSEFVKHSKYYVPLQNFSIAMKILQVCLSTLYSIHVPALYVCAQFQYL